MSTETRKICLELLKAGHPVPRPIEWLVHHARHMGEDVTEISVKADLAYLISKGLVSKEYTAVNQEKFTITAAGIDVIEQGNL
ncbi:MAG: hypothetical protein LBV12_06440 [Puniceicoccales bacterium]|jgi:RIO-like serine/threonine protein kinase|nr:hypothetical protein [Puniceicoccales bacterium]